MKEYGDYHGDEDEIESARQEKEENDPRHEPNFDEQEEKGAWFGMTRWNIDDVKYLAPTWTDEQCHEFMEGHDRYFKDRMIELGWETLELYVAQEEKIQEKKQEIYKFELELWGDE